MRYLSSRLRYYYFQFRKTNGRHIGILLPVCSLSYASLCVDALYNRTKFRQHVSIQAEDVSIYKKSNMASAAIILRYVILSF